MNKSKKFSKDNSMFNFVLPLINENKNCLQIRWSKHLRGAYDKFPDFFHMGTFIDSTHMKL